MKKVEATHIKYYDLFDLLEGLESERPGIKKRVWDFLKEEQHDIQFEAIKGRTLAMNLFYYGVGDEYPLESNEEVEHSKKIHPEAFVEGRIESELRKDFNLIWFTYNVKGEEIEMFYIMPNF